MSQDWRIETDASDYFGHRKKESEIEQRRPVIRRASDLVGPGIASSAVRVTNWSNVLATFNGYYSSLAGAIGAPNEDEAFVGTVVGDDELGGVQTLTGLSSGLEYSRSFVRNPADPETLGFTAWIAAPNVASMVRLSEYNQYVAASTWTSMDVRLSSLKPNTRGSRVTSPANGVFQVTRDGWYEIEAQANFTVAPSRAIIRLCTSDNPDVDVIGGADTPSAGASYQFMKAGTIDWYPAGTRFRIFLWQSAAGTIDTKAAYCKEA